MPRDFQKVIREVKEELGLTSYKLATIMGRDHTTVKGWEQGTEPKYSDGEVLIAMHDLYVVKIAETGKLPTSESHKTENAA